MNEKEDQSPLLGRSSSSNLDDSIEDELLRKEASSLSLLQRVTLETGSWAPIDSMQHSFNPSIEGLRGIAVSSTMLCHVLDKDYLLLREYSGQMGVNIFFVLSGFLITGVLIRAQSKSRSMIAHLPRFYLDRFFRLGPAVFLLIAFTVPMHYRIGSNMTEVKRYAILVLTYLVNWPSLRPKQDWLGPWANTWSLACEEQFYIFWALALPFILHQRVAIRTTILITTIAILFFGFRIYGSTNNDIDKGTGWHFGMLANIWKMLIGSSLRLIPYPTWMLKRRWAYVGLLGLLAIPLGLPHLPHPSSRSWIDASSIQLAWDDVLSSIFTVLILCGISGPRGGLSCLEVGPLRFLGRISYSWYLWQVPLIELNGWERGYAAMGDTAISFVIAICSTFYIEEPINGAYKRWKSRRDCQGRLPI